MNVGRHMPQASYPPDSESPGQLRHCGVFAAQVWYVVAGRQGRLAAGSKTRSRLVQTSRWRYTLLRDWAVRVQLRPARKSARRFSGLARLFRKGEDDLLLHMILRGLYFKGCTGSDQASGSLTKWFSVAGENRPMRISLKTSAPTAWKLASVVQQSPRAAAASFCASVSKLTKRSDYQEKYKRRHCGPCGSGLNPDIQQAL